MKFKKNINFNKKEGFTLIELIAVMAIIGILATMLLPQVTGYIKEAKKLKIVDQCRKVVMAVESYNLRYSTALSKDTKVSDMTSKPGVSKYLDGVNLSNLPDETKLGQCYEIVNGAEFTITGDNDTLDISKGTPDSTANKLK